jgi:hypothetical protein
MMKGLGELEVPVEPSFKIDIIAKSASVDTDQNASNSERFSECWPLLPLHPTIATMISELPICFVVLSFFSAKPLHCITTAIRLRELAAICLCRRLK